MNFLEGLDNSQREAVECTEGPVLIVAGAGSGKTRVLTNRITNLLAKGIDAHQILALTFTKKAATDMKSKIASILGERQARSIIYMGTFHSVFIRLIRPYAEVLGYIKDFSIYSTSDSESAIKACLKELKLDDKTYKPKDVLSRISSAKNSLVTWQMYRANEKAKINDAHARKPEIYKIYELYQKNMLKSGVMDYDDILLNMNILMYQHPDIAQEIASKFTHVMVDEYQDTNHAQYSILRKLCEKHNNICVVGDDSQSIYAFRGAKIENILNFKRDYPKAHIFMLERNYRSTRNIVEAANSLIEKNSARIKKNCYAEGDSGEKIRLIKAYNEQEEAQQVIASIISRRLQNESDYKDFAILYRTNSQSRAMEEALRKRNIPYRIYAGNSFFDRAEVKDMMAYFKLSVNPNDNESFKRIVNLPARGIGATTINTLIDFANAKSLSLIQAIESDELVNSGLKAAPIEKLRNFSKMIRSFHAMLSSLDAYNIANKIADTSGLYAMYKLDNSIESQARAANIEELINSIKIFVEDRKAEYINDVLLEQGATADEIDIESIEIAHFSLAQYLEESTLLSSVDTDDKDDDNKVTLMTVHSSKGLEFPYVYIVGMEENLFPSFSMLSSPSDVEEERRLFYVAITRAKIALSISFAEQRMRHGQLSNNPVSRFVKEIKDVYLLNPDLLASPYSKEVFAPKDNTKPWAKKTVTTSSYTVIPSNKPKQDDDSSYVQLLPSQLHIGMELEHNRFGRGRVKAVTGSGDSLIVSIDFPSYGEKKLSLKYAKFKIA